MKQLGLCVVTTSVLALLVTVAGHAATLARVLKDWRKPTFAQVFLDPHYGKLKVKKADDTISTVQNLPHRSRQFSVIGKLEGKEGLTFRTLLSGLGQGANLVDDPLAAFFTLRKDGLHLKHFTVNYEVTSDPTITLRDLRYDFKLNQAPISRFDGHIDELIGGSGDMLDAVRLRANERTYQISWKEPF